MHDSVVFHPKGADHLGVFAATAAYWRYGTACPISGDDTTVRRGRP